MSPKNPEALPGPGRHNQESQDVSAARELSAHKEISSLLRAIEMLNTLRLDATELPSSFAWEKLFSARKYLDRLLAERLSNRDANSD